MNNINRFDLDVLRNYFQNIMMACDNKEKDERLYIRSVAECGFNIVNNMLKKEN